MQITKSYKVEKIFYYDGIRADAELFGQWLVLKFKEALTSEGISMPTVSYVVYLEEEKDRNSYTVLCYGANTSILSFSLEDKPCRIQDAKEEFNKWKQMPKS